MELIEYCYYCKLWSLLRNLSDATPGYLSSMAYVSARMATLAPATVLYTSHGFRLSYTALTQELRLLATKLRVFLASAWRYKRLYTL